MTTRPKEVLAKFNQWLVTRSDRYYQPQDLMGEALREAVSERDHYRKVLQEIAGSIKFSTDSAVKRSYKTLQDMAAEALSDAGGDE